MDRLMWEQRTGLRQRFGQVNLRLVMDVGTSDRLLCWNIAQGSRLPVEFPVELGQPGETSDRLYLEQLID